MNIKQWLILLGGAALLGVSAYLTTAGQGLQPEEYTRVGIVGGMLTAATAALMWAFRD